MKRRRIIQVGVGGMGLGWTDRIAESRRCDAAAYVDVNPKNLRMAVNYFGSWVSSGWETEWNADWCIEGSKGVLLLERDELFFSRKPGERRPLPVSAMPKVQPAYLLEELAQALDSGREPETSGRNNLTSLATTHAVVRAVQQNRRVAVRELMK